MYEIFAIVAGMLIGLLALSLISTTLRITMLVASGVAFGTILSFVSGELFVSWAFLVFDIIQVLIAAVVTMALATTWQHLRKRA